MKTETEIGIKKGSKKEFIVSRMEIEETIQRAYYSIEASSKEEAIALLKQSGCDLVYDGKPMLLSRYKADDPKYMAEEA